MTRENLTILAFCEARNESVSALQECSNELIHVQIKETGIPSPAALARELEVLSGKVLVFTRADHTCFHSQLLGKLPAPGQQEVWVAASAYFYMEHPPLHYFYWKHFPRSSSRYPYLDSSVLFGQASALRQLLASASYPTHSLQVALIRHYTDHYHQSAQAEVKLCLDSRQEFFASTEWSARGKSGSNWLYRLMWHRAERLRLKKARSVPRDHIQDFKYVEGAHSNTQTGTTPVCLVVHSHQTHARPLSAFAARWVIHWQALRDFIYALWINKFHMDQQVLFRFAPNQTPDMRSTEHLISRLEAGQPLSFAHYNDGELSFIRDFQEGKDHQKWFGRKQQQYDPLLASRLLEAMKFRREGYFVGVPCGTDHPALRALADRVVGDYDFKVPAMTLHHNLAYLPRLLFSLKGRRVSFFKNEYQDLSFFQEIGIDVDPKRVHTVPFKNSYLEYDRLKDFQFEEGEVVVLTCGMLAKILTKVWYENHSSVTILAMGSAMDDLIQKANIHFELFPPETPVTRNIHHSRSFLFGYKKPCNECFQLK